MQLTSLLLLNQTGNIPVPPQVIGPDPTITQEYVKALSLSFLQTYITSTPKYQSFLSASYAQFISQELIPLSLVRSLMPEQLEQKVQD